MQNQFYVRRQDRSHGPFNAGQLKELAASGKLLPSDFVGKHADGKWTAAQKVRGLVFGRASHQREIAPTKLDTRHQKYGIAPKSIEPSAVNNDEARTATTTADPVADHSTREGKRLSWYTLVGIAAIAAIVTPLIWYVASGSTTTPLTSKADQPKNRTSQQEESAEESALSDNANSQKEDIVQSYNQAIAEYPLPSDILECHLPTGESIGIEAAEAIFMNNGQIRVKLVADTVVLRDDLTCMFLMLSKSASPEGVGKLLSGFVKVGGGYQPAMPSTVFIQGQLYSQERLESSVHTFQGKPETFGAPLDLSALRSDRYIAVQLCAPGETMYKKPVSNVIWVRLSEQ